MGIVTTADDPASCAFVQWCERAELFGRALRLRLGWNASVRVLLEPGVLIATDDLPCMQVLTTARACASSSSQAC